MEIGNANILIFIFGIILHSCPAFDRVQTTESTSFEIFFCGRLATNKQLLLFLFIYIYYFLISAFRNHTGNRLTQSLIYSKCLFPVFTTVYTPCLKSRR